MPQINPPAQQGGGIVFATPTELITKALEDIGVLGFGSSATPQEINSGLKTLNAMLDMWGVLRENISLRSQEEFILTVNQSIYYIGNGAVDFDTIKPIKIEKAFYRDENNADIPIDCSMQEGEYAELPIKNQPGVITRLFYKPSSPFGVISFDAAPMSALTLVTYSWKPIAKISDPNDITALSYPDGYEAAILYNLEVLLCSPNKKPVPAEVYDMATSSIRRAKCLG
jgi:hypothetical protein